MADNGINESLFKCTNMKNRFGKILADRGIYRSRLLTPYISGALSTAIISEQWLDFGKHYIIQPHLIAIGPRHSTESLNFVFMRISRR